MKRREFSLSATAAGMLGLGSSASWAQAPAPQEGKEYSKLLKPASTSVPAGKVEVIEFFWYNCPHCFAFEPAFEAWKKQVPDYVVVSRAPVAFQASFVPQQKLYFTLLEMKLVDSMHTKVFNAIHEQRQNLSKEDQIFDWMSKQPGVDMKKFKDTFNSFSVANQVKKASSQQEAYGVEGVPAMGVAGLYYTDGSKTGSMPLVLRTVDYLTSISRKKA